MNSTQHGGTFTARATGRARIAANHDPAGGGAGCGRLDGHGGHEREHRVRRTIATAMTSERQEAGERPRGDRHVGRTCRRGGTAKAFTRSANGP